LQEVEDDDEDDAVDVEDVAAEDEDLLGAAADLLPALAVSMGQDAYAAAFLSLHAEPLLARLRPQQPAALRAIASGAAAEVAESLGGRIAAVVEPLLPLMLRELQTEVRAWQTACRKYHFTVTLVCCHCKCKRCVQCVLMHIRGSCGRLTQCMS
jgi:hypothetical protein